MIKPLEIQNTISKMLKEKTGFKVYSNEDIEGFKAPCFFVSAAPKNITPANKRTVKVEIECEIVYYPYLNPEKRVRDEISSNEMISSLSEIFILNIAVADRYLLITDKNFDYGGQNKDLLRFSFKLSFFDSLDAKKEGETIADVEITTNT